MLRTFFGGGVEVLRADDGGGSASSVGGGGVQQRPFALTVKQALLLAALAAPDGDVPAEDAQIVPRKHAERLCKNMGPRTQSFRDPKRSVTVAVDRLRAALFDDLLETRPKDRDHDTAYRFRMRCARKMIIRGSA